MYRQAVQVFWGLYEFCSSHQGPLLTNRWQGFFYRGNDEHLHHEELGHPRKSINYNEMQVEKRSELKTDVGGLRSENGKPSRRNGNVASCVTVLACKSDNQVRNQASFALNLGDLVQNRVENVT